MNDLKSESDKSNSNLASVHLTAARYKVWQNLVRRKRIAESFIIWAGGLAFAIVGFHQLFLDKVSDTNVKASIAGLGIILFLAFFYLKYVLDLVLDILKFQGFPEEPESRGRDEIGG